MRKYVRWDEPASTVFVDGPSDQKAWEYAAEIGYDATAEQLGLKPQSVDNLIRSRRCEHPARRTGFRKQCWNEAATLTVADARDGELLWQWADRVGARAAALILGVREKVVSRALAYRNTDNRRRNIAWDGPARAYFPDAPDGMTVREYAAERDQAEIALALGIGPMAVYYAVRRRRNGEVGQPRVGTEMESGNCIVCGMELTRPVHGRKWVKGELWFCGHKHEGEYRRQVEDVRQEREEWMREWGGRQWIRACLSRDQHTCQICGYAGRPQEEMPVHHRLPFVSYRAFRSTLENGMTVCRPCHDYLHSNDGELVRYRLQEEARSVLLLALQS